MGTSNLVHLLNRFNDSLWFLTQSKLELISSIFSEKLRTGKLSDISGLLNDDNEERKRARAEEMQVERIGKVAVLPIFGTMMAEASGLDALSGFTSTFERHQTFLDLQNDMSVETIVLHFRSPGGQMLGGFEFADSVLNSPKKVVAFTDTEMNSLAFLIGSAAQEGIFATPSSTLGSIGVRLSVMKVKESNVETHIFQSGKTKTFGDPNVPMTEAESTFFQDKVDQSAKEFFAAVSVHRDWPIEAIIATEAASNNAMFLKETPFVDHVMSREQFIQEVRNELV